MRLDANLPPIKDGPQNLVEINRWGAAHPTVWNMAFCDGSVRGLTYDIEPQLHRRNANRLDGEL